MFVLSVILGIVIYAVIGFIAKVVLGHFLPKDEESVSITTTMAILWPMTGLLFIVFTIIWLFFRIQHIVKKFLKKK